MEHWNKIYISPGKQTNKPQNAESNKRPTRAFAQPKKKEQQFEVCKKRLYFTLPARELHNMT